MMNLSYLDKQNLFQPDKLFRIPKKQWPYEPYGLKEVWRSKKFLVQIYEESGTERLSVVRASIKQDQSWGDGITWEELQLLKSECGRGDKWAVEIYPADENVVNVANMRHLWLLPEAPAFAWKKP